MWFLIGFLICLFVGDWLRVRAEVAHSHLVAVQSLESAERQRNLVESYSQELVKAKILVEDEQTRSKMRLVAQVQAIKTLMKARPGDKALVSLLAEAEDGLHDDIASREGEVEVRPRQAR